MQLHCDTASRLPIYKQLVQQVREGVATGRLRPGERLPSVRQLSKELVINPNTVARAYTELERAGVLNTRQGLGVFVAEGAPSLSDSARQERLLVELDRFLTEAVHLHFGRHEVERLVKERLERYRFHDDKPSHEQDSQ